MENKKLVFCKNCIHYAQINDINRYYVYKNLDEMEWNGMEWNTRNEYNQCELYKFKNQPFSHMCFKNFHYKKEKFVTAIGIDTVNKFDSKDKIENCEVKNKNNDCGDFSNTFDGVYFKEIDDEHGFPYWTKKNENIIEDENTKYKSFPMFLRKINESMLRCK